MKMIILLCCVLCSCVSSIDALDASLCSELSHSSDPGRSIQIKPNDTFAIRMEVNPTTGYQWFLSGYDPTLITPIAYQFCPPITKEGEPPLVGASGYDIWRFKVKPTVVPQVIEILFRLMRPWVGISIDPAIIAKNQKQQLTLFTVVVDSRH